MSYGESEEVGKKKLRSLTEEVLAINKKLERMAAQITKLKRSISMIDEHKVMVTLDGLEDRISSLSERAQADITKYCVCTEVTRFDPSLWPVIVTALDESNGWWLEKRNLTLAEWIRVLKGIAEKKGKENAKVISKDMHRSEVRI